MSRYVKDYLQKRCSSELQELFSTANNSYKEITESMAALHHLRKFIHPQGNMTYIVIGDGRRCLTAASLAFLTRGTAYSVDPVINVDLVKEWKFKNNVQRFYCSPYRLADAKSILALPGPYTLVMVHSHVSVVDAIKLLPNWRYIYSTPCCLPLEQTLPIQYQEKNGIQCVLAGADERIMSDKNQVFVYRNNKAFPADKIN
jgi:hypothetical protein